MTSPWRWLIPVSFAVTSVLLPADAPAGHPSVATVVKYFLAQKDYLGLRVYIRREFGRHVSYEDWFPVRGLLNTHANGVGFDIIEFWNSRYSLKSSVDSTLDLADSLSIRGDFEKAVLEYQKVAAHLKRTKHQYQSLAVKGEAVALRQEDIRQFYRYVLHSLGRALYGAKRFEDALTVYHWIPTSYPRYRQVLFERMWTAFRAGRVELALGAIASQRTSYFSRYLSPEAYLIQIYLYKKLCRTAEIFEVEKELQSYMAAVEKGRVNDWAESDLETLVLQRLVDTSPSRIQVAGVTWEERERERRRLATALAQAFQQRRPSLLKNIKDVIAYASLARVADAGVVLKPIEKLKGREQLSKMDLEIWPADSKEEWADEVGSHYFLGDSLCHQKESK